MNHKHLFLLCIIASSVTQTVTPFFCLFPPRKKTREIKLKTPAAHKLYQELFKKNYETKPKAIHPIAYKALVEQIEIIEKIYKNKWQKNDLENPASVYFDAPTGNSLVLNDDLQPVLEKISFKPHDEIYIHGDIHSDVLSILSLMASLQHQKKMDKKLCLRTDQKIILLGDYSDRGLYPAQTIAIIAKLLEANPKNIFLLRGNHETRDIDLATELFASFQQTKGEETPARKAVRTQCLWQKASSYFPHVLFIEQKKAPNKDIEILETAHPVIACMHAAPPSYQIAQTNDSDFFNLESHCMEIKKFLQSSTRITKTHLDLSECYQRGKNKSAYFPPYLWNYLVNINQLNQTTTTLTTKGSIFLGDNDIALWMKKCSTKTQNILSIIKGHQHYIRDQFNGSMPLQQYGLSTQFNDKVTTLNIGPRCVLTGIHQGHWENRGDTWLKLSQTQDGAIIKTPLYFDFFTGAPTTAETILTRQTPITDLLPEQTSLQSTQSIIVPQPYTPSGS